MKGTTNMNAVVARSCETSSTEKDLRPASSLPDGRVAGADPGLCLPEKSPPIMPTPNREEFTQ
jgi:hypothetical protein